MKRHRIVLDTSVLISAILFSGPPRKILELVIRGAVACSLSLSILDELRDVLQRPKFAFSPDQALDVLEELRAICDIVDPRVRIAVVTSDPDDNAILECALASKADFVVSGDEHLLEVAKYKGIRILAPSEYLRTHHPA